MGRPVASRGGRSAAELGVEVEPPAVAGSEDTDARLARERLGQLPGARPEHGQPEMREDRQAGPHGADELPRVGEGEMDLVSRLSIEIGRASGRERGERAW